MLSDFNSSKGWYVTGGKQIQVAGNTAIEANMTYDVDGRGNPISPLRNVIVDLLDKKQTGKIELQFKTPANGGDDEVAKFNKLLSTFKFTN